MVAGIVLNVFQKCSCLKDADIYEGLHCAGRAD